MKNAWKPKSAATDRGFQLIEFLDQIDQECSVQESSAIRVEDSEAFDRPGSSYLWVGVDVDHKGQKGARMHLSHEQVTGLHAVLTEWLLTGRLSA